MDISNVKWNAQLHISGVAKAINLESQSIQGLLRQTLATLNTATPRKLANGKEITLIIRDTQFSTDKSTSESARINDIISGIDTSNSIRGPFESESFEDYYQFLLESECSESTARYIACDWFDRPQDPVLNEWLNDSKVKRFISLNCSNESYLSAMPNEYESLKSYIITKYPTMCEYIVFRIA